MIQDPQPTIVSQRRRRRERGQSLVELALVIPVFFVLVFGIVDFGLGLKAWITITNSAREAARYAAVTCATTSADEDDVIARAETTAAGLSGVVVTVTNCPGSSTESVIVEVEYDYVLVTPLGGMLSILGGVLPSSITLHSTADMRLE